MAAHGKQEVRREGVSAGLAGVVDAHEASERLADEDGEGDQRVDGLRSQDLILARHDRARRHEVGDDDGLVLRESPHPVRQVRGGDVLQVAYLRLDAPCAPLVGVRQHRVVVVCPGKDIGAVRFGVATDRGEQGVDGAAELDEGLHTVEARELGEEVPQVVVAVFNRVSAAHCCLPSRHGALHRLS